MSELAVERGSADAHGVGDLGDGVVPGVVEDLRLVQPGRGERRGPPGIVVYGALSPEPTPPPVMDVLGKHLTLRGFELFEVTNDDDRLAEALGFLRGGLADGSLRAVVDRTFALDDVVAAHEYLESNAQFGKVVLTVE